MPRRPTPFVSLRTTCNELRRQALLLIAGAVGLMVLIPVVETLAGDQPLAAFVLLSAALLWRVRPSWEAWADVQEAVLGRRAGWVGEGDGR